MLWRLAQERAVAAPPRAVPLVRAAAWLRVARSRAEGRAAAVVRAKREAVPEWAVIRAAEPRALAGRPHPVVPRAAEVREPAALPPPVPSSSPSLAASSTARTAKAAPAAA